MGVSSSFPSASCERGQATVELMITLPVMLAVALIVMNGLLFFSECAAFERIAMQAVRVHAASPAYGQDTEQSRALIAAELEEAFARDNLATEVAVEAVAGGKTRYDLRLEFSPTLFGMGLRSEFFGVALPKASRELSFTIDVLKPGVLI